jgi:hypothetical protein
MGLKVMHGHPLVSFAEPQSQQYRALKALAWPSGPHGIHCWFDKNEVEL